MYHLRHIFLLLVSISIALSVIGTHQSIYAQTPTPALPTVTPTPNSTPAPLKLGVNFWDPDDTPNLINQERGGYVLLMLDENLLDENLTAATIRQAEAAHITPILRFNYQVSPFQAVPTDRNRYCDWGWDFIDNLEPVIEDLRANNNSLQLEYFVIVGNEPALDTGLDANRQPNDPITAAQYAAAYVFIQRYVGGNADWAVDINECSNFRSLTGDVTLHFLIAGQAAHKADTSDWPGQVIANIDNSRVDLNNQPVNFPIAEIIDGFALHTYGYGNHPGQFSTRSERPDGSFYRLQQEEGIPDAAQGLEPINCEELFGGNADLIAACQARRMVPNCTDATNPECWQCPDPSDPALACESVGVTRNGDGANAWTTDTWAGDDSFQNYREQIGSIPPEFQNRPIFITEFNTYLGGDNCNEVLTVDQCESPVVPSQNYRTDWIEEAVADIVTYNATSQAQVSGLLWFAGHIPNETSELRVEGIQWRHFVLSDYLGDGGRRPFNRLYQARLDFCEAQDMECELPEPQGNLYSSYLNEAIVSVDQQMLERGVFGFWVWDPVNNPITLDVYDAPPDNSSPITLLNSFDLTDSNTALTSGLPQNPLAAALRVADVPDQAVRWQMVLTDRFGETATSIFEYNPSNPPPCNGCGPGGDNPDDNFSAASVAANTVSIPHQATTEAPLQRRQTPRIAVLDRGFQYDTINLLAELGEPAIPVTVDFSPAMVENLPVLLIPTGALMGLGDSALFQARLEAYAEAGGTIVVFAQQRGADFSILPGSELSAFGWDEDVSCFWQGYYISANHPIVSGFDSDQVSITNDGYFTVWPEEAEIILSRTRNGQPAALIYPYGQGQVFATTAYFDWGQTLNQISPDSQILMRDLLTWATQPNVSPETTPNTNITVTLPITNENSLKAIIAEVDLINPARQLIETREFDIALEANQGQNLDFDLTPDDTLGIWRFDYRLKYYSDQTLQLNRLATNLVVADPAGPYQAERPLRVLITSPSSTYFRGSLGTFTIQVFNSSDQERTVVAEANVEDEQATETLVVPANGSSSFVLEGRLTQSGVANVTVLENGFYQDGAVFQFQVVPPSLSSGLQLDQTTYVKNSPIQATLAVTNSGSSSYTATVEIKAIDDRNVELHFDRQTVTLLGSGNETVSTTFSPPTATTGSIVVTAQILDESGQVIGGAQKAINPARSPLKFNAVPQPPFTPGQFGQVVVTATNRSAVQDVTEAQLAVALYAPNGDTVGEVSQGFDAIATASTTLALDVPVPAVLEPGNYTLAFTSTDAYAVRTWQQSLPLNLQTKATATNGRTGFVPGETILIEATLTNASVFELPLTFAFEAGTFYQSPNESVTLAATETITRLLSIDLPPDVERGSYPLEVSGLLFGMTPYQKQLTPILVPAVESTQIDLPTSGTSGQPVNLTLTNPYQVSASVEYQLMLFDQAGYRALSQNGTTNLLNAGQSTQITVDVPAQLLASNDYYWQAVITNTVSNRAVPYLGDFSVNGLSLEFLPYTDQIKYRRDQDILVGADINAGSPEVENALLKLEIYRESEGVLPAAAQVDHHEDFDSYGIASLAFDGSGQLWVGGSPSDSSSPLKVFSDDSEGDLGFYDRDWPWPNYITPLDIHFDTAGVGWFASESGAARRDTNGTMTILPVDDGESGELASSYVRAVTVDNAGHVWFATDNGVSQLTDSGGWINYFTGNNFYAVAVDPSTGDRWFGAENGLYKLGSDSQTAYYTTSDGLVDNKVMAIAIDNNNNLWLGTPYGVSHFITSSNTWQNYQQADGLARDYVHAILVDPEGSVWFGHDTDNQNEGGATVLRSDGTWQYFDTSNGFGTEYSEVWAINDFALDPQNDSVWLARTNQFVLQEFNIEEKQWGRLVRGLASPLLEFNTGDGGGISNIIDVEEIPFERGLVWEREENATTEEGGYYFDETLSPETIPGVGRFTLVGTLTSASGQRLGQENLAFYIFEGDIGLTLEVETPTSLPNATLSLNGSLLNDGDEDFYNQELVVRQDGQVIYTELFDLIAFDEGQTFTVEATLPASAGEVHFQAELEGNLIVDEYVTVIDPEIELEILAPATVGQTPFDLIVNVTNPISLAQTIDVGILATNTPPQTQTVTLEPFGRAALSYEQRITKDTTFVVNISGDVVTSQSTLVEFGQFEQDIQLNLNTLATYQVGSLTLPYTLTNVGAADASFTTAYTLTGSGSTITETIPTTVLVGQPLTDTLEFDLSAGNYTITLAAAGETESQSFQVFEPNQVTLTGVTSPILSNTITVSNTLVNVGLNTVDAILQLEGPAGGVELAVSLVPGETQDYPLTLNLSGITAGTYVLTSSVVLGDGQLLDSTTFDVIVEQPDIQLVSTPDGTSLAVGQENSIDFVVENVGQVGDTVDLYFDLYDLTTEVQRAWIEPGSQEVISLTFTLPNDLTSGMLVGQYRLVTANGDELSSGEVSFSTFGLDLTVNATWDAPYYSAGDSASLTLEVVNQNPTPTDDLYLIVIANAEEYRQTFNLTGNDTQTLNVNIPAVFEANANAPLTVFYGIYHAGTDRAIHLNTAYVYPFDPGLTLTLDQQVYQPGDQVQVTVVTTATGNLLVTAPGYEQTLTLNGQNTSFNFTLPSDLTRGTKNIFYTLTECNCAGEGLTSATPFDITRPRVRVTEVDLQQPVVGNAIANLTLAAEQSQTVVIEAWLGYPDLSRSASVDLEVQLEAVLNNQAQITVPFASNQMGVHWLAYVIQDAANPSIIYATGSVGIDQGSAQILSLQTAQEFYQDITDPVVATATIHSLISGTAQIEVEVDNQIVSGQTIELTQGVQSIELPLPQPGEIGWHTAQLALTLNGFTHQVQTRYFSGLNGPDLRVTEPILKSPLSYTSTVELRVFNSGGDSAGASTLSVYDGDPLDGGIRIAEVSIPALEPTSTFPVDFTWDVKGKSGPRTLYALIDTNDDVVEAYETNNQSISEITVPQLALTVRTDKPVYDGGQIVAVTTQLTNLDPNDDLTVNLETYISQVGYRTVQTVTVPADDQLNLQLPWDSTDAPNGNYFARVELEYNDQFLVEYADFIVVVTPSLTSTFYAEPLEGSIPLTVTFTDISTGTVLTRTWNFGDGNSSVITNSTPTSHTYSTYGLYTVTLAVENLEERIVITQPDYILAARAQLTETVTLEAETYDHRGSGADPRWVVANTILDHTGDGYVQTQPDVDVLISETEIITAGPELQYNLGFTLTGTYIIWLRGYAPNAAGDSVYVGLDGQVITPTGYISEFPPRKWAWGHIMAETGQPLTFTIDQPGVYTLNLWLREDGLALDQIIITQDTLLDPRE